MLSSATTTSINSSSAMSRSKLLLLSRCATTTSRRLKANVVIGTNLLPTNYRWCRSSMRYAQQNSASRRSFAIIPPRVVPRSSTTTRFVSSSGTGEQAVHKSIAGTGRMKDAPPGLYERTRDRGPVSWSSLFLVGVAAASAVAYYRIERERRLEQAMGKVVSSESDGWTPKPDQLAKRQFVQTKWGYFPVEDGFGAREFFCYIRFSFSIH